MVAPPIVKESVPVGRPFGGGVTFVTASVPAVAFHIFVAPVVHDSVYESSPLPSGVGASATIGKDASALGSPTKAAFRMAVQPVAPSVSEAVKLQALFGLVPWQNEPCTGATLNAARVMFAPAFVKVKSKPPPADAS
jgi:hypothetical protein